MQHKSLMKHCVAVLGMHHDFPTSNSVSSLNVTNDQETTAEQLSKIVDEDQIVLEYCRQNQVCDWSPVACGNRRGDDATNKMADHG